MVQVFSTQLDLICAPGLVPDKSKSDSVFRSKTSMNNASSTIFTLGRCNFSTNKLKFIYNARNKALRTFTTSRQRHRSQTPSHVYATLTEFSAILRAPFSPKSRLFLLQRNFRPYYAGTSRVPPQVLAVWAKTLRGQIRPLLWVYAIILQVVMGVLKVWGFYETESFFPDKSWIPKRKRIVAFTKRQTRWYLKYKPPLLLVKFLLNGSSRPKNKGK